MRLIDADWVLAALGVFNDRKHGDAHFFNGIASAEEIVEHAPTIATRDWTPCAEGLPTVKETVLATIADGFGNDIMFAWYDGENWKDGYKNKIPVIAWQHLPTPYRADDTTGKVKEDAEC